MTYLIFSDYNSAYVANAIISLNMRLSGNATQQWAEPQQRITDNKYCIPKPDTQFMNFVTGYTEETYSINWFTQ